MKRLLVLAGLVVALTSHVAKAGGRDDGPKHHRHMAANELAGIGVGAAALFGALSYLLLRRRHSS